MNKPPTTKKTPHAPTLTSTIHWTWRESGLPQAGRRMAIWIASLDIVVQGYIDARTDDYWRMLRPDGPPLRAELVTAWTYLPDTGPLPPPQLEGGPA